MKAGGHYDAVKETYVPKAGLTVADFDSKVRADRPGAKGGGVSRPLEPVSRESFEIVNEKRLIQLQKKLDAKSSQDFLPGEIAKQRRRMQRAVRDFGDKKLSALARSLSDEQFNILWNYSDAPRDMFEGYHYLKLLAANTADEANANIHEDSAAETREWLEWAKSLNTPQGKRSNRRK